MFTTCVSDAIKLVGESIYTSVAKARASSTQRGFDWSYDETSVCGFLFAGRISFSELDSGVVDATVCVEIE